MAIQGHSYTKTNWAFEERPVASSKLNLWDDRIEAALELVQFLIAQAWGGNSGVLRGVSDDDLAVAATSPESLIVEVGAGYALIDSLVYKLAATTQTVPFTSPTLHPRRDIVQARLATWDIGVKQGNEAASPVAPLPDSGCIVLAEIHLRVGATSIKDVDDATNGYIVDVRSFL